MKASEIREILAVTQRSDIISFAGGLPNPQTFPTQAIEDATRDVLARVPQLALQYSPTDGIPELREEIAKHLNRDGTNYTADNILVTNGSQQGLDLIGRVLLDPGSKVLVGSPTYLGAIQAFENYLVREKDLVAVRSDQDGMDPASVEETLDRLKREGATVKAIYTCPTFQNPAGTVMSASRRRKLLELAHAHDVLIIEDDPYGKLRFDGDEVPKLASMDKEDRVIYLGTFSKILVPGFRLAWTAAHPKVVRQMSVAKQAVDLCTNAFTQFITAQLMQQGLIDRHLPEIIALYRSKRDIMMKAMEQRMPSGTTWTRAQGGLFTWAQVPEGVDTAKMFPRAIQNKVAYVPGRSFFVNGRGENTMRINFSHPADEMIPVGVERLAATIEAEMKASAKVVA
jgi:2-aminoadipate transaminase